MRTYTVTCRNLMLTAGAALLALTAAAPSGAAIGPRDVLTFSRAVALPGVVIPAGAYAFEVANPDSSSAVVRVTRRDTRHVHFAGFTMRVTRPASLPLEQSAVSFGEAPAGEPVPITAWYPAGRIAGYRFDW